MCRGSPVSVCQGDQAGWDGTCRPLGRGCERQFCPQQWGWSQRITKVRSSPKLFCGSMPPTPAGVAELCARGSAGEKEESTVLGITRGRNKAGGQMTGGMCGSSPRGWSRALLRAASTGKG